jgi:hypothetical protein
VVVIVGQERSESKEEVEAVDWTEREEGWEEEESREEDKRAWEMRGCEEEVEVEGSDAEDWKKDGRKGIGCGVAETSGDMKGGNCSGLKADSAKGWLSSGGGDWRGFDEVDRGARAELLNEAGFEGGGE